MRKGYLVIAIRIGIIRKGGYFSLMNRDLAGFCRITMRTRRQTAVQQEPTGTTGAVDAIRTQVTCQQPRNSYVSSQWAFTLVSWITDD